MLITIRKLTMFLLLMFSNFSLHAQQNTASVRGVVKDDKGTPVEGASVLAVNTSTNVSSGTQINDTGVFTFERLPPERTVLP